MYSDRFMKKIVVIGGGFAGSMIAKSLEDYFDVTLIDSKDYFEFTPSILRTIIEPEHIRKIQVLHKNYLKKSKIVLGSVSEITKKDVKTDNEEIDYDYLVVCSGSSYNLPIKEQNVVYTARADHLRDYHDKLERADKVVIIGGGLVGVELAGEICTFYPDKKITLIHAGKRLMERNIKRAGDYAEKFLRSHKVELLLNELVTKVNKEIITNKGNKRNADIVFACTGIKPNSGFMNNSFSSKLNEKEHIKVNSHLQIEGLGNIFSAGDVNSIMEEKTAQNALEQAKIVVNNIKALENNIPLKEYESRNGPLSISLGKWDGILIWKNMVFRGLIPGLMKSLIEKWKIRDWKK